MRLSLRKKLVISISLVVLIFGLIATFGIFYYAKNAIFDLQKESLKKITVEQSHETRQLFDDIKGLTHTLADQEKILRYLEDTDRQLQEEGVLGYLNSYNIINAFSAIYLMDAEGLTLVSTDETFVGNNYGFRSYFNFWCDPHWPSRISHLSYGGSCDIGN